eukprot:c39955_g1_i1.p1 GENE.c39955_g1_i1~~c39955_g1_i1.p1  ORF type:complete len:338 (-),score=75.60 c39955_g1_i1:26-1003(-)
MMRAVFAEDGQCVIRQVPIPTAGPHECLVEIKATAVNRADTLQRRGLYPPPPGAPDILGLEFAGVIKELGEGVSEWKVGDRVMGILGGGGYAEYISVYASHLIAVPPNFTWSQAGAVPEVWLTAYQIIFVEGGGLKQGDVVLIHAGGSGVGTAATQLSVRAGAHVIVTAGADSKIERAKELGAIGGVNYKSVGPWGDAVKALSPTGSVDLVLDCVGGSYCEQNADVLGVDGRWVIYGLMGGMDPSSKLLRVILSKRLRIIGSSLRARSKQYKADLARRFERDCLSALVDGTLLTIVDRELTLNDVQQAHEIVEANDTTGKVVLLV